MRIDLRNRIARGCAAALAIAVCVPPVAAHDNLPAPPQSRSITLVGATLHPQDGPAIANGRLRFAEGRIEAIGGDEVATEGSEVIDLGGRHVYPGMIAANSQLGLSEIEAVRATVDTHEVGGQPANARAESAINPDSEYIPVARANGVLLALSRPNAAVGVAGTSVLLRLEGWTVEDMQVEAPLALHVVWPQPVPSWLPASAADAARKANADALAALERHFEQSRDYARSPAPPVPDLRLAAMRPFIDASRPVVFHVDRAPAILEALAFARRHGVRPIIGGGLEAWRVADALRAEDVPVIVGGTHSLPLRRQDAVDAAYANPARLQAAGVRFAIAVPDDGFEIYSSNLRNLPYHAATAVGHGLPREEAIKAITLYPAQILGVADRVGSLAVGREATLFVADGDPLEITTQVQRAWIGGREIDLRTHQTRLYDKFRQRYPQTRDD